MSDLRTIGMVTNQQGAIAPQVSLRAFQGESDYAHIAAIIAGCKDVDQIERVDSEEDIRRYYSHLVNCDPYEDMCFVDAGGQTIGYSRVMWWEELHGAQIYRSLAFLLPAWRRRGIGSHLLEWGENRLREIAAHNPPGGERFFESAAADTEMGTQALLESHGYQPVRHFFTMLRSNLENIPEAPLPAGLEVRPVRMEDLSTIREASVEAFRDHWGFNEENEPTVEQWVENPNFDPCTRASASAQSNA
jgi:GNAT superfamily N-acetyltransferase